MEKIGYCIDVPVSCRWFVMNGIFADVVDLHRRDRDVIVPPEFLGRTVDVRRHVALVR